MADLEKMNTMIQPCENLVYIRIYKSEDDRSQKS